MDVAGPPRANGGGGSSKLGNVGAPARRVFNGWVASASSAVPMPGVDTARDRTVGWQPVKRSEALPSDGALRVGAKEGAPVSVQS